MKRIHLFLAISALLLFVVSSFAVQGKGQGQGGRPAGPGVAANPNAGNAGGGNPGGNPNAGGNNPGGSNAGGGNPNGANPGSGNANNHGGNPNVGGNNPGGSNSGGANPNSGNPGNGNAGNQGGNPNRQGASAKSAEGFKNYGQYVAAQHAAERLGIPLAQLKTKMTGPDAKSLGKAIQEITGLPANAANAEAKEAEKAAKNQAKKD